MKRPFSMLLALIFCFSAALADGDPAPLLDALDDSWSGWTIPLVTNGEPDEYACRIFEDYGFAMAVLTNRGANILCIFEPEGDAWRLVEHSASVLRQGECYPRVSDDSFTGNGLTYLHGRDSHPLHELAVVISRNDDIGWHVTAVEMITKLADHRIVTFNDDGTLTYIRFAGDEDEQTVALSYDNRLSAFDWTTFPQSYMQAEKAIAPYIDPIDALD